MAQVALLGGDDPRQLHPITGSPGQQAVTDSLSVRAIQTLTGEKTRYYQVVDTEKSKAVGPATPCPDRFDIVAGVKPQELSPPATVVGVGQAVVHLDTGAVTCLATLSQDLATSPTVVADDGAAFGEARSARSGTFYVNASGRGAVDTTGKTLPVALLNDVAIFATDRKDGIVAYRR